MIVELGHFALILALCVAIIQVVIPLVGAHKNWTGWMAVADPAATTQFLLVGFSFAALTYAFVTSDFSLRLVTMNSHTLKPMLYKVTGVWGNHEGSMLLWVLILALFGASASWFGGNLPKALKARVIAVQGAIGVAFLTFILFTSNPFLRLAVPPFDGEDLNPLLQDPGLAFHPPFLYLGYVGLSMTFSFAIAALIEGRVDAAWGRWVRPWTLAAWLFLTVGIALGSWWAYYELGWGGFWFWDPVENASFMPWLIAAALLHSAVVVEKREALKAWTILLAILAFGFSLIGTFIVRSGVLTSVHAFANDPERGVFILIILLLFVGGALSLFAARASALEAKGIFAVVSREGGILLNNILLSVAAFVVFVGTLWPLFIESVSASSTWQISFLRWLGVGTTVENPFYILGFFDRPMKLSVGAPFFNSAFTPFMIGVAVFMPVGTLLAWKRGNLSRSLSWLVPAMVLSVAVAATVWAMQSGRSALAPIGILLGLWVVLGAAIDLWSKTGRGAIQGRFGRLIRLPRADWGRGIAHSGFGITIFAISALLAWQVEDIRVAKVGERFQVAGFGVELRSVRQADGPNYRTTLAEMAIYRGGVRQMTLFPEKRVYPVARMPTTEAAINSSLMRDIYLVIGDLQEDGGWTVRTYIKPFAIWIWGGAILMALGGLMSLSDRRYRVAAGARKRPSNAVPAE